jgi:hypothetical protein
VSSKSSGDMFGLFSACEDSAWFELHFYKDMIGEASFCRFLFVSILFSQKVEIGL